MQNQSNRRAAACLVAIAGAIVATSALALADPYDPPANYYNGVTGTGAALKASIRTAISTGFVSRSYGDARFGLQIIDRDPNIATNIILIYNSASVLGTWDLGITWNREHTWPQSFGNTSTSAPQYSDQHMLRPCNPSLNSSRGNLAYGPSPLWDPNKPGSTIDFHGEAARAIFYAATKYGDPAGSTTTGTFVIINGQPVTGESKMGDLASLLKWHYETPVSTRDRRRNQLVFDPTLNASYYQNNRNPYIDHPEWVWAIWGTQPNNSTLYVGGAAAPDGSSSQNISFGPVITGAPSFATQNVTLNKSGTTPTTFDITVSGAATCSPSGPRQAFAYNPLSRTLTVGVTTAGIGSYSGAISIDNTDLTSGGAGQGVADANDTINISATILDHASPSLDSASSTINQTIDFGSLNRNTGIYTLPASVFNRVATPGLTAGLDVDSVSGVGSPLASTSVITTTLIPMSNIPATGAEIGQVALDTAQPAGSYQVTYTIATSDQNLLGAIARPSLTLTVLGTIVASCPGDLNGDLQVDDLDFVLFAAAYDILDCTDPSMPAGCPSDLNSDLSVDDLDFVLFATAYDTLICP